LSLPIVSAMLTDVHARMMVRELVNALSVGVDGDVVEFGCNMGTASVFLQKVLLEMGGGRKLWCYDSFKGLPLRGLEDENWFKIGNMASSRKQFEAVFARVGLSLPEVKEGWFKDLSATDLPRRICFAYLDCDLYASMKEAMALVISRLALGGKMLIHDTKAPGVRKAMAECVPDGFFVMEWNNPTIYGFMCLRRM